MYRNNASTLRKKGTSVSILFAIIALIYIAHKLLPVVGYYISGLVYFGVFFIAFMYAIIKISSKPWLSLAIQLIPIFSVSLLFFICNLLNYGVVNGVTYLYGEFQILLYALIAILFVCQNDPKLAKVFTLAVFLCYMVTAITTYIGCINYEGAARTLATLTDKDPLYRLYSLENIGSFTFIYELVLIVPIITYMVKKKRMNRIIGLIIVAFIGLVIFKSEYTTAILLYAVSLVLFLIPKPSKTKIIILLSVSIVLFLCNSIWFSELFQKLSTTVESDVLSRRFEELSVLLKNDATSMTGDSNTETRIELYSKSLNTFWSSGMFGGWFSASVGGHSYVFDTLGMFGILGVLGLVIMYRTIYKSFIYRYREEDYYPYLYYIFLLAVFMACINPKSYLFIFVCIIPLFGFVMRNKKSETE